MDPEKVFEILEIIFRCAKDVARVLKRPNMS